MGSIIQSRLFFQIPGNSALRERSSSSPSSTVSAASGSSFSSTKRFPEMSESWTRRWVKMLTYLNVCSKCRTRTLAISLIESYLLQSQYKATWDIGRTLFYPKLCLSMPIITQGSIAEVILFLFECADTKQFSLAGSVFFCHVLPKWRKNN